LFRLGEVELLLHLPDESIQPLQGLLAALVQARVLRLEAGEFAAWGGFRRGLAAEVTGRDGAFQLVKDV